MLSQFKKSWILCLLCTLLLLNACTTEKVSSRFDQAQQESTQRGASSVVRQSVSGSSFNRFFPPGTDGYERVYTQEKKGFAEAKLKQDGQEMAVMAIADTLNNPSALTKFEKSTQTIGGYPVVAQGSMGTAVLVADRFQVKVLSRNSAFTQSDRIAWLEKFDLDGLAALK